jgi:hypothetical protein
MKAKKKLMYVQGAYLQVDDYAFLQLEARRTGVRSATAVASKVMQEWIAQRKIERAREIIREADHGQKKQKGRSSRRNTQATVG